MLKWFSSVGLLIIHHPLFPYYGFTTPSLPTCIPYIGTPRSRGSFGSFRCLSNDWIHRPAVLPCLYAPLEPHSLPQPGWAGFLPLNVSKWLVTGRPDQNDVVSQTPGRLLLHSTLERGGQADLGLVFIGMAVPFPMKTQRVGATGRSSTTQPASHVQEMRIFLLTQLNCSSKTQLLPRSVDINIRRARLLYTLPTEIIYPSTLSVITLNLWYHE